MTVNERFNLVLDFLKKNPTSISKELGVSATTMQNVSDGKSLPSAKVLIPLAEIYPNISLTWLLTGKGEMIIEEPKTFIDRLADKEKIITILESSNEDLRKTIKLHEQTIKKLKTEISKYEKMVADKAS